MFVDKFSNENDLTDALHDSGIAKVVQYNNEQDDDNNDDDANTDEDSVKPPVISLEPSTY